MKTRTFTLSALVVGFALLAGVVGCGHKTLLNPATSTVVAGEEGGNITAQVVWVKNKKETVDVFVKFTNQFNHPVTFRNKAFQMTVDGEQRGLKNPNFTFELASGETIEKPLIFAMGTGKPRTGEATMVVTPTNTENGSALPVIKIVLPLLDR